jgi:hypothetical protein
MRDQMREASFSALKLLRAVAVNRYGGAPEV